MSHKLELIISDGIFWEVGFVEQRDSQRLTDLKRGRNAAVHEVVISETPIEREEGRKVL